MISKLFPLLSLLVLVGCAKDPTSPTGSWHWQKATSNAFSTGGRYGLAGTVFGNSMWAAGVAAEGSGGATVYFSDVWSSGNGSSWQQTNGNAPFGGRFGSQMLSYNGKLWLIGGNSNGILKNDVWNSTDGTTWTNVLPYAATPGPNQFVGREDFGAVVYNNLMWVIGGWTGSNKNDVWSSPDGVTWTQVLANGAAGAGHFAGRWGFACLVYNNAIWLLNGASSASSGSDPTAAYGDVWSSNNGSAWVQVSNAKLHPLYYEQAVVSSNNLIFLTLGYLWNGWGAQGFQVTSPDGINWSQDTVGYVQRFGHLSLEYNNSVWVIGGCNNVCLTTPCPVTVTYYNDVWYTK